MWELTFLPSDSKSKPAILKKAMYPCLWDDEKKKKTLVKEKIYCLNGSLNSQRERPFLRRTMSIINRISGLNGQFSTRSHSELYLQWINRVLDVSKNAF
jgi:hypothetical protein